MPRSRSRSIESSTCSPISRSASPPHNWMKRSASVDLPWSMCAMIEKLRMRLWAMLYAINKEGAAAPSEALYVTASRRRYSALVGETVHRDERHRIPAPDLERDDGVLVQAAQQLV